MRIPSWTPEQKPQPDEVVSAIRARRGGTFARVDLALLWSGGLARGWNAHMKAVRTELSASRPLCELAIATVALITGERHEFHSHSQAYLALGGKEAVLAALRGFIEDGSSAYPDSMTEDEDMVVRYAEQMTRRVQVDDALFARLAARYQTAELVEITATIATYNMVTRFLLALDVHPDA